MHFGHGKFSPLKATTTEHILSRGKSSGVTIDGVASILS